MSWPRITTKAGGLLDMQMMEQRHFTRSAMRILIRGAILGLVSWGIYLTVSDAWAALSGEMIPWQPDPVWLVVAAMFYLLGMLPMALFWHRSLLALGCHPRLFETLRAYCIGSLGKYVPGKAMVVVLRTRLLMSARTGGTATTVSVFLETLTMMAVGAFLALSIFLIWLNDHIQQYPFLIPLAVALLIAAGLPTCPGIFKKIVLQLGTARIDGDMVNRLGGIRWALMRNGWILMFLGWCCFAGSLWSIVRGIGLDHAISVAAWPYCVAAITMAIVAGFLSLIPGGAGVREYLISVILGHFYFAAVLDLPFSEATALVVAVVLRLLWLAVEFGLALIFYVVGCFRRPIRSVE